MVERIGGTAGFRQRLLQTHLKEQVPVWRSYINVSLEKAQLLLRKKNYSSPEGGLKTKATKTQRTPTM